MFNLNNNELTPLIVNVFILLMLISSLFIRSNTDKGHKIKQLAIWLTILFFGVLFYNNKHLFKNFIPYIANDVGENKIEIRKSSDNHFYIALKINEINILFLIDTGATTTSLTLKDAKRIGIDSKKLIYNQMVNTANGISYNASTEIENIEIGNFRLNSLWVLINKDMSGHSLLGMNFLNKLKGYDIRQDIMTLYY